MKTKILELSKSPVISSQENMQNFILFMQLPNAYLHILQSSHNIIRDYYTKNMLNYNDEGIIDNALLVVSGQKPNLEYLFPLNSIYTRANDGKQFVLQKDGLVLRGGIYPISNYQDTIHMFLHTDKYKKIEEGEEETQTETLFPLNSIYKRKDDKKLFVLTPDGLVPLGSNYPTFNYQHSLEILSSTKKYHTLNINELKLAIKKSKTSNKTEKLKIAIKALSSNKKVKNLKTAITLGAKLSQVQSLMTQDSTLEEAGNIGAEATIEMASEVGAETMTEEGGNIIVELLSSLFE